MKTFVHKVTSESKGRGLVSIMAYFITRKCCHGPRVADVKVWHHGVLAPTDTEVVVQAKLKVSNLEEKLGARYEQNGCKVEEWVEDSWQCFRKA